MTTQLSNGASGAIRRFAGWVARGSVGYPLFEAGRPAGRPQDEDYRDVLVQEPSAMETLFAVFANDLLLGDAGEPVNEKYAERRAAAYLHQYLTGRLPEGEPEIGDDESTTY